MFSVFLFFCFVGWVVWSVLSDKRETGQMDARITEKIRQREAALQRMPDSPSALESLGDALREAGRSREAAECYERATALAAQNPQGGFGVVAGSGLDGKLRLARLEASEDASVRYGQTLATRPQVCRRCGHLSLPQARDCESCGGPLAVDTFLDTWKDDRIRATILRESANTFGMLLVVLLALYLASWMPLEVKGCLGISAAIVLAWRFLRAVGGD